MSLLLDLASQPIRNLVSYPRTGANFGGYGSAQTITPNVPVVGAPGNATRACRVTYAAGVTNPGVFFPLANIRPGARYSIRCDVLVESGHTDEMGFALIGQISQGNVTIPSGVWTRFVWNNAPGVSGVGNTPGFRRGGNVATTMAGSFLITNVAVVEAPVAPETFADGDLPNWRWLSGPGESESVGYPYTLESIAGRPLAINEGPAGNIMVAPDLPAFRARTLYAVYETTSMDPNYFPIAAAVDATSNAVGNLRLATGASGADVVGTRIDLSGGTSNGGITRTNVGARSNGRHVICASLNEGITRQTLHVDQQFALTGTLTPGSGMAIPAGNHRLSLQAATTGNTAIAAVLFEGEHSDVVKARVMAWLARRYGGPIAYTPESIGGSIVREHSGAALSGLPYDSPPIAGSGGTLYVVQDIPSNTDTTTTYRGARYRATTESLTVEQIDANAPPRSTGVFMVNGTNQWISANNRLAVPGKRSVTAVTKSGSTATGATHSIDTWTTAEHPSGPNTSSAGFQFDLQNPVVYAAYFPREHNRETVVKNFEYFSRRFGSLPNPDSLVDWVGLSAAPIADLTSSGTSTLNLPVSTDPITMYFVFTRRTETAGWTDSAGINWTGGNSTRSTAMMITQHGSSPNGWFSRVDTAASGSGFNQTFQNLTTAAVMLGPHVLAAKLNVGMTSRSYYQDGARIGNALTAIPNAGIEIAEVRMGGTSNAIHPHRLLVFRQDHDDETVGKVSAWLARRYGAPVPAKY